MSNKNTSQYILPNNQPVVSLEVKSAFDGLTTKEKLYAHHLSKASWHGGLITLLQTSPESGPVLVLLHKLFSSQSPTDFKAKAISSGFTEDEVTAVFVYTCGVFTNSGNYKGFGDTKFIPNLEKDRFGALLKLSPIWPELEPIWLQFKDRLYDLENGKCCLGYSPSGITTYLSHNCTPEDNEKVQNWLKTQDMECYNTRLFKTVVGDKITYDIRLASEDKKVLKTHTDGNVTYQISCGDYSPLIGQAAKDLSKAIEYAANQNQVDMLKAYISSFQTGSLDDHKLGSRYWIKDKGPAVESYIGFIETYRDPAGVRGEFEGFVAAVNRAMSAKFATLVSNAEQFLTLLPWNKGFEKDKFLKPDFTSLDVLTFAGSGIPAGINIPNYDEIRQEEGFKNVSLGNVIPASYQASVTPFLTQQDADLLQKWRVPAFELQVSLNDFGILPIARFVLSRVLIQAGVVSVTQPSENDLLVTLDRSAIQGAGRVAIGQFLLQLQIYKATGNLEKAQELYNHYAEVTEPWLSWRSIVLANKQPRKMFVQANTSTAENGVSLKSYEPSLEGLVQSWVERFSTPQPLYDALLELSKADAAHF
uniref:Dipeptidyl peptidase 3 n=1 Tax=Diabrotica virgifera virgifera TaxID=50390 RepID=A0A6P7FY09_DIAVI